MNKQNLFLISVAAMLALLPACQTTPKKIAYQTLAGVGLTVQKSMQAVAEARREGRVADDDWRKIVLVHDTKYLPAYHTACDLAAHDYSQFAPAELIGIQAQLITLINQLLQ